VQGPPIAKPCAGRTHVHAPEDCKRRNDCLPDRQVRTTASRIASPSANNELGLVGQLIDDTTSRAPTDATDPIRSRDHPAR